MSTIRLLDNDREHRSRVLIADDEPANLEVLFNTLASDDEIDIIAANNGSMALALTEDERPDLVLLDAIMPGMDGFAVCRALKANTSTADIPVIFITSLTDASHKIDAFHAGAVDFITKPFHRAELLARVRTHLALQKTARALIEKNARLEEHIRQRDADEKALALLTRELERRTEELGESNARLRAELDERARAETAKVALQEEVIRVQRERLLELSAPLIPITESILAMPLIGTLDIERAEQVVETALRGASQSQAEFVIVDITGVRAADRNVASMFMRLAAGLHLLGRRALITGISPDMAQTLIGFGIALDDIVTRVTLQSGIRYALEASGERGIGGHRPTSRSNAR